MPPVNPNVEVKRLAPAYIAAIDDGDQFIAENIGEEGLADVARRTEVFERVAANFATSVGKVSVVPDTFRSLI